MSDYSSIRRSKVHTPRSIHQATFKGSNVHIPVYFYIEKNSKWPLFWYTYIRKNPFELSNIRTPEHLNTIICSDPLTSCVICYHSNNYSVLITLSSFQRFATFEDSNVHRPVYFLYRKKLQMSTFLVYLYKKKPFRALKHLNTWTPEHQILCSDSVLKFCATCAILTKLSWPLFSLHVSLATIIYQAQRTAGDYPLCSAHWRGLSLVLSALAGIIPCAQRTGGDYPLCSAHWRGLSLHFSRTGRGLSPVCLLRVWIMFDFCVFILKLSLPFRWVSTWTYIFNLIYKNIICSCLFSHVAVYRLQSQIINRWKLSIFFLTLPIFSYVSNYNISIKVFFYNSNYKYLFWIFS